MALGTQQGQVSLLNLSPQGAQTRDQLPGAVVRTEIADRGMLALDEQGRAQCGQRLTEQAPTTGRAGHRHLGTARPNFAREVGFRGSRP